MINKRREQYRKKRFYRRFRKLKLIIIKHFTKCSTLELEALENLIDESYTTRDERANVLVALAEMCEIGFFNYRDAIAFLRLDIESNREE